MRRFPNDTSHKSAGRHYNASCLWAITALSVFAMMIGLFAHLPSNMAAAQTLAPETISLDGNWEILFDPDNRGRESGWHLDTAFSAFSVGRTIEVPSCWELVEQDYEGVAYYRRTFMVPANWEGKISRLQFDAVNFAAEVWVNDQAVGSHQGGFTPFEFRIDQLIRPGEENSLVLRVAGPILLQDKRVDGIGPMETPQWRGAITGGIWQSVRLVASGNVFVNDVFIEPQLADSSATFHLQLSHTGEDDTSARIDIEIESSDKPGQVVARLNRVLPLQPGTSHHRFLLNLPSANHWSPDSPHLYLAKLKVSHGATVSDRWSSRFGMREFTIRDNQFYLNGEPLYLKACFFEGLYPIKLAQPDSREMAAREIRLAKDAGFNMIRPWRKPPPPMWLDLADEMGVLTVGSLAIECMDFPVESAQLPRWVEHEVRQSILRDRNRACIVQWELFNELKRPVLKQMLHPMSMLARQLDPTRLILDESGGWARGARMYQPYESVPTRFNDIHNYPGPQINDKIYEKLRLTGSKNHRELEKQGGMPGRNVVPGLMTYFSELGYGSLPDLVDNNRRFAESGNPIAPPTVYHRRLAEQQRLALRESGFDTIYPDLKQYCLDQQIIHGVANRRMIEAVRCNPHVNGYCVHALTDGDWIIGAGLLDLFRRPKTYAYVATQEANQPQLLSIRIRPRNVYAQRGTKIQITGVNETTSLAGQLKLTIVASDGEIVSSKAIETELAAGITQLFDQPWDTSALRGSYTAKVEFAVTNEHVIARSEYPFDVFAAEQLIVPQQNIAVLDPNHALKPFLENSGISFVDFEANADPTLPVLVSRTEAKTPIERKHFDDLKRFVDAGGTAVYLQGGGSKVSWGAAEEASPLLPVRARTKRAIGNWACVSHLVKQHPIFAGLPTECMMGSIYENVWAETTLLDIGGETIVGSIGYDVFPDYDLSKRHYYGPGDSWWGADVAVVALGRGRCITSHLRLVENLGSDPVAEKILFNLIEFASTR